MLGSPTVGAADQALADLTDISSQVEAAALFDAQGSVAASTLDDPYPFVRIVQDLFGAAEEARDGTVTQLEAATGEGSVFVVREGDRYIAAVTRTDPTVALVFYDLKTALRAAAAEAEKPKRAAPRRPNTPDTDGDAA
jgi:predicted regulator of Ras-like GTPase activity (Roadblock/LC7/MglB family)